MEKVLFYCGEDLDEAIAVSIFQKLNMNLVLIKNTDLGQTLGYLAGREGFEKTENDVQDSFQESFLILDQVQDKRIIELSKAFEEEGMPYRGIKAMITDHNQYWKIVDLFWEIRQEHAYFSALQQLRQLLEEGNQYHQQEYTENSWEKFQVAILEAYMTYQARPKQSDDLIHASNQLREAMDQLLKV